MPKCTPGSFFTSAGSSPPSPRMCPWRTASPSGPLRESRSGSWCWLAQQSAALPELPPTRQAVPDTRTTRRRDRTFVLYCGDGHDNRVDSRSERRVFARSLECAPHSASQRDGTRPELSRAPVQADADTFVLAESGGACQEASSRHLARAKQSKVALDLRFLDHGSQESSYCLCGGGAESNPDTPTDPATEVRRMHQKSQTKS